jgi:hypothetical protein
MNLYEEVAFVVAGIVAWTCQRLLFLGKAMVFDDGVLDIPTIHAPMATGPHVANRPMEIQEVLPDHQPMAA